MPAWKQKLTAWGSCFWDITGVSGLPWNIWRHYSRQPTRNFLSGRAVRNATLCQHSVWKTASAIEAIDLTRSHEPTRFSRFGFLKFTFRNSGGNSCKRTFNLCAIQGDLEASIGLTLAFKRGIAGGAISTWSWTVRDISARIHSRVSLVVQRAV